METRAQQTADAAQEPQWTWLARIRRPQGRKGEVFADILTDFPEKFAERRRLWLVPENARPAPPREVALANHWLHKGGIVLHFAGVDSINDAETLAGLIVAIPRTERAPLADDETYIGDLIGCALVDVAGATPRWSAKLKMSTAAPAGGAAGGARSRLRRRNPRALRQELPAQNRPRGQARGDGAARRSYRPELAE